MLSSSGSVSRRTVGRRDEQARHHVVRDHVAEHLLGPVVGGQPSSDEQVATLVELIHEERVDLRPILGGGIRILAPHGLDLAIGPLLELCDL